MITIIRNPFNFDGPEKGTWTKLDDTTHVVMHLRRQPSGRVNEYRSDRSYTEWLNILKTNNVPFVLDGSNAMDRDLGDFLWAKEQGYDV